MIFFLLTSCVAISNAVDFQFVNNAGIPIWVGIQGDEGHDHLNNGGLVLDIGETVTIEADEDWSGRLWPRSYCNEETQLCVTGDCGSKLECAGSFETGRASLAQITLKAENGLDHYSLSLVEGFNVLIAVEPVDGTGDGTKQSCTRTACSIDFRNACPNELRVLNSAGATIACNSGCNVFLSEDFCCTASHGTAETCVPTQWRVNYADFFRANCPNAYSYVFDQHDNTYTCQADTYKFTFGGV